MYVHSRRDIDNFYQIGNITKSQNLFFYWKILSGHNVFMYGIQVQFEEVRSGE